MMPRRINTSQSKKRSAQDSCWNFLILVAIKLDHPIFMQFC
jgi:hypothetical protein